jgi:hypothetical protein
VAAASPNKGRLLAKLAAERSTARGVRRPDSNGRLKAAQTFAFISEEIRLFVISVGGEIGPIEE